MANLAATTKTNYAILFVTILNMFKFLPTQKSKLV